MKAMYRISLESLFEAYWDCRRNKSRTASASEFEVHYEEELINLHNEITSGTYTQKEAISFVITKPDYREIFASHFRDRIIHHWIRQRIEPIAEQLMIPATFNCRRQKGVLAAQQYVFKTIRDITNNYTSDGYVMKVDIKGFFMSIDRALVCEKVVNIISEYYQEEDKDTLLFLLRKVLLNAPERYCCRCGNVSLWRHIKPHKSLFTNGRDKGLPIGDLVVQMAANLLLNDVDHFITDTLGIKMARYVDDMVLISDSKSILLDAVPKIRAMLLHTAGVELHPTKFYLQHYTKGVKFVGAVIKPYRTYVANRTVNNAFQSVRHLDTNATPESIIAPVNSYLGLMRHHSSYNIRKRLVSRLASKWRKFIIIGRDYGKISLRARYKVKKKVQRLLSKRL